MRVTIVIPARYASTRFPGKPLADIAGKPMIRWVWEGARTSALATRVVVATDDERIAAAVRAFGGEVVLTSPDHPSGTDRIAEVARADESEIFVNVQGDEPLMRGDVIDAVVGPLLADPRLPMSTASRAFEAGEDPRDPNLVKVVTGTNGDALYFSRSPIPFEREPGAEPYPYRLHLGIYGYRRDFLLGLARLAPTALEQAEKLEQLRVLEHGHRIRVVPVRFRSIGVDRPEDIARVAPLLTQG